jgi:hypothetical protein
VTWQQRVLSAVVLAVLMLTPAAATVCAVACQDARAVAHCHEESESASPVQLTAAPGHDCASHGAIVAEIATLPQYRLLMPDTASVFEHLVPPAAAAPRHPAATRASSAPPGSDPRTTTPTVLRV